MFCPKCGRHNDGDYKFCRGCGENLKLLSKVMERRWRKMLNRALDGYIRHQDRKFPESAKWFRRLWWMWLTLAALFSATALFGDDKDWWAMPLLMLPLLVMGLWDYISYRRLSASRSNDAKLSAQTASLSDSLAELPSAPTTNELTPPFSATESTTRRLEPLTAAERRSGELL
jgi:hypothetical protein